MLWLKPGIDLSKYHRLTYGTLIAAINFDRSGTTRIGRFVLNHSFMLPGLVSTAVAITVGLLIGKAFF